MHGTKLPKLIAATALAVVALGATSAAQAGTSVPQKHPDIIGVLVQTDIIGVLGSANIIAILKQGS